MFFFEPIRKKKKILKFNCGYPIISLFSDANNNIYCGDSGGYITKLSPNVIKNWNYLLSSLKPIYVASNNDGNIYAMSSDRKVVAITSTGNVIWGPTLGPGTVNSGLAVDNSYFYPCSYNIYVYKCKLSDRSLVWQDPTDAPCNCVVVDSNGYVYCSTTGHLYKIAPTGGTAVWNIAGNFPALALDTNNNIYIATSTGAIKVDTNNNVIWTFTNPNVTSQTKSITLDSNGYVYLGDSNSIVTKLSLSGTLLWQYSLNNGVINAITVDKSFRIYTGDANNYVTQIIQ